MAYTPKYKYSPRSGQQVDINGEPIDGPVEGGSRWNQDGYQPHGGTQQIGDPTTPGWGGFLPPGGGWDANQNTYVPPAGGPDDPSTYWNKYFKDNMNTEPQIPGVDTTNADQDKAMQQQLMQQLQAQAAGTLDTQAQRELGQSNFEAQGGQYALAAGQRGTGAGAQLAQAQTGAQQIQAGLGGQQQILMRQQQQAAQAQLAQMYAAQQGQDQTQANNVAQAQVRGQAQNDQMNQYYAGQGVQSSLDRYQTQTGLAEAKNGMNVGQADLARGTGQLVEQGVGTGIAAINSIDWKSQQQQAQASNPNEWSPYPYQNP